jgi:propionate CoA-transferase
MDAAIFDPAPMGLRERLLAIPIDKRFSYDPALNVLFINFERLNVKSERDVARIRSEVEKRVGGLGHKVYAIVNYAGCVIDPMVFASYSRMVEGLVRDYYLDVTRYGTSGFLRMKLGEALESRGVASHIYESAEEARSHLKDRERKKGRV